MPTDCSIQVASRFSRLLLDSDSVSYCNICRKYSDFAYPKSLMFIGKIVDRMDIYLSSHQSSAKYEDTTKTKYMSHDWFDG
jgi:hypothetical protein